MNQESVKRLLPGRRLRDGREQAGLTEEQVARKLHMSVTFVRAIEADDYERLPEAAFIKGYMRNYARLVDVPADEVANLFQQMIEEDDRPESERSEEQSPRANKGKHGYLAWLVPLVLGLLLLGWWLAPDESAESVPEQSSDVAATESIADEQSAEPPLEETLVDDSTVTATDPVESVPAPEAAPAAITPDQLVIRFNGPCWVQVLDASGETLFSGQKDDSAPLRVSGMGPFRITFGNGAAVNSLTVNDKSVSVPPSAPGNVVRVSAP